MCENLIKHKSREEAKEAFLLQNPSLCFGKMIKHNYRDPFRDTFHRFFIKDKKYLVVNALDMNDVKVLDVSYIGSYADDIYDDETGEYETYLVYYEFKDTNGNDYEIAETNMLKKEEDGYISVYEMITDGYDMK